MKNVKKWIFSLILSLTAITSLVFIPRGETFASTNHTVYFNYDYNSSELSNNLPQEMRDKYSGIKSTTVISGSAVTLPKCDSDISGYYELSWKVCDIDGQHIDFNPSTPITSDITLFADWTPIDYYIYFIYPDDIKSEVLNRKDNQKYNFESTQQELYRPQRENYVFVGWFTDETLSRQCLNIPAHSTSDFRLYPKWRPIDYIITYHDGGENLYNNTSYNVETGEFTLKAPTKTGHTFMGWYLDEDFTHELTAITSDMAGDIDLYAKWEALVYNVTYILPDGTQQVVKCKYGETADLPKVEKSIFEVIKTSSSRDNITEDTIILISKNNIWYVYFIGLIVVLGIAGVVIFFSAKRTKTIKKLRYMYQSNYKKI